MTHDKLESFYKKISSSICIILMIVFIVAAWVAISAMMGKISIINTEKGDLVTIRMEIDADITESLAESNIYLESIKDNPQALMQHIKDLDETTHILHRFGRNKEKAYQYLASHYLVDGDFDKCLEYSEELIALDSNNYQNHILYGNCLILNGEKAKAFDAYENAWEIYPISFELNQKLIELHKSKGFDLSPTYIKKVYSTYPDLKESLQFYFATAGAQFDEEHYTTLNDININLPRKTYKISLQDIENWKESGMIKSLRIDPIQFKSDGLVFGIQSMVFKKQGSPDIVIEDFSEWMTSPSVRKADARHFRVLGNDSYVFMENSFSIPSDYEELHLTLDFNIDV